jgi:hypothetical protein
MLGAALNVLNAYALRRDTDLEHLPWERRYWEDVNGAIRIYLGKGGEPEPAPPRPFWYGRAHVHAWRGTMQEVVEGVQAGHLRVAELWRTVPIERVPWGPAFYPVRSQEDKGRALLLSIGFKALGGVSPFLLLWLGALFFAPALVWSGVELARYGRPGGAAALAFLCGLSPYVAALVTLPHSGMGFYLASIVAVIGLASYAVLDSPTAVGLLWRAVALGAFFALCVRCRQTALATLPGFVLALAIGTFRARLRPRLHSWGLFLALSACFLTPYLLTRDTAPRPTWFSLWMGLGDFDRSKGYVWRDNAAQRACVKAGHTLHVADLGWTGIECEAFYRQAIFDDVRKDPLWFASILAKRIWATIALPKLWPRAAHGSVSFSPSRSVNEGAMDIYYLFAPTVDWMGIGEQRVQLPLLLLVGPALFLVALALPSAIGHRRHLAASSAARSLLALSCPALSALAGPVLFSTASGPETQAFAIVHFLAAGFLVDACASWLLSRRSPRLATDAL